MSDYHTSVLLHEAVNALGVVSGKKYIDATLGGGGHTLRISELGGQVLALDVDREAVEHVKERFKIPAFTEAMAGKHDSRFKNKTKIVTGNFRKIDEIARENGFDKVAGVIFDLGVSSHQLDNADRGFSFLHNAQLDMRMDKNLQVRAKDLLKVLSKGELYEIFKNFGEERFANRIASNIVDSRRVKPIETTADLEAIVRKSVPLHGQKINPATRVFQALRIAVNDEMGSLEEALPKALSLLEENGRLVVISFHSLEDRIVKHTFRNWEEQHIGEVITKKPVEPDAQEITANPRSRSAKMRIFERN